jgi:cold shock protein
MATGTVKFFNEQKGFGFIEVDGGGPDMFVHISEVEKGGISTLHEGQKVSFDSMTDPRKGKESAVNVKVA